MQCAEFSCSSQNLYWSCYASRQSFRAPSRIFLGFYSGPPNDSKLQLFGPFSIQHHVHLSVERSAFLTSKLFCSQHTIIKKRTPADFFQPFNPFLDLWSLPKPIMGLCVKIANRDLCSVRPQIGVILLTTSKVLVKSIDLR